MLNTSKVLDTLRLDANGIFLKKYHVERTFDAFQVIEPSVTYTHVLNLYNTIESLLLNSYSGLKRVRILFTSLNEYSIQQEDLILNFEPIRLTLSKLTNQKYGLGLHNLKWQDRSFWDQLLLTKSEQSDDIVSLNMKGEVTETSRFNIFFYNKNLDTVFTPPLESGCINGVYRRYVFENKKIELPQIGSKKIIEKNISISDLATFQIFVANSVRGIMPAKIVNS
ncbi:MAG: aminotransferase class IV [Pseudobdellovibrio sp.]